jgi:hypothetical protein
VRQASEQKTYCRPSKLVAIAGAATAMPAIRGQRLHQAHLAQEEAGEEEVLPHPLPTAGALPTLPTCPSTTGLLR